MTGVIQPSLPATKGHELVGTVPATANCSESSPATAKGVIRFTVEMAIVAVGGIVIVVVIMVVVLVVVVAIAGETSLLMIEAPVMVVGVASKGATGVRSPVVLRLVAEKFPSVPLQLRSLTGITPKRNPTNLPARK